MKRTKATKGSKSAELRQAAIREKPGEVRKKGGGRVSDKGGDKREDAGCGEGGLPFVFVNMAMTADGKIATANREVSSFGSRRDQRHLLELRATADAVMAGARTIDSNPVTMGPGSLRYREIRIAAGFREYNVRVIVSRRASVDPGARIFQSSFSPIVLLTTRQAPAERVERLRKLAEVRAFGAAEIDFAAAFRWLRHAHGVKRLLCEGGGELNDALFRAGLVDELHLTVCPFIFGGRDAPTICDGQGAATLVGAARMKLTSSRRVGNEMFLVYRRES